ncbi:MAG: hypothetical protein PHP59_05140 [Methanofollis sp.]|uniref:hypothetical protein n=1 Tax=Methanofollis sp. TaxID=2052835 RepID=UPI00260C7696|nr:hypothetical protein [Methanofollis sp.]MDD4254745.1 hypothetical protein [Methanofollis sp.]
MHAERTVLSLLIAAALLFVPCAAATGDTGSAGRIIVSPADDRYDIAGLDNAIRSIGGWIYPGETDTITKNIPSGTKMICVRLDWSGHSHTGTDSVSLIIYPPDGGCYGPYLDNVDGTIDEKISLDISDSPSLPPGEWQFDVHGDSVPQEGDAYTLSAYLYS